MASARYSPFSLLTPHANGPTPPRIPLSSKRHRKNHLRPKILKTLTKPYPPTLPLLPSPPQQPVISPQENNNLYVEIAAGETLAGDIVDNLGEVQVSEATTIADNFEELQVSDATAKENGVFENVSAVDIFKYGGMYFLGFFVLQTVYTVWVAGNYNSTQKDGDLEVDGRDNENGKTVSLPVNGASNVFGVEDQLDMEKKIEEIRLMAREARRIELEKKGKEEEDEDFEMDDEGALSGNNRLGIEKEIGERLLKLQNRINGSTKDISAALQQINTRRNPAAGVDRGVIKNVSKGNEAMVFKKKFKFKSPSTKATKTPKGFPGTRDWRASNAKKKRDSAGKDYGSDAADPDNAQVSYEDKQVNQQDDGRQKSISSVPTEGGNFVDDESKAIRNHGKNLKEKKPNMKTGVGVKNRSGDNVTQPRKLRDSSIQNSKGFVEESQETIVENDGVHSINGGSRHGLAKKSSAANRVEVKKANTKTGMWWLNLRYVFVILMQRDSDEGSTGLYSFKFSSKEQDLSDDSYTVAFEDHADANNFCFLLESFFKDLGSFSADAVPMSIQELNEEIISRAKKVVVVKKRQLQLYAGQPLADVEMALCSIIEQDQNAP
ncbi:uncharacterized protein LOC109807762 isoform X2 [Cajanus cajan]|uniref:uncharacterized protein LOC109807762 isoform X2 n=1 Tax=Cajanus cajan TaxID=3821 RepID=UPI00098D8370|nr:uncharacterized protein LOC109807762 isoform X2 [Cajanus cajan]